MGTLYERIKYLCDAKGIKPGKMCTDTGISKGLISDLKYGRKKSIMIETAQKMADYFNVPVGIITGTGDKKTFSENLNYHFGLIAFDTPEKVAEKIGVATEQFNAWLAGDEYPDINEIDRLADYYGILREDLINVRPPEQEEFYRPTVMDANTFDAMCKFKCLSPTQQKVIIRQMETFILGKPMSFPEMD